MKKRILPVQAWDGKRRPEGALLEAVPKFLQFLAQRAPILAVQIPLGDLFLHERALQAFDIHALAKSQKRAEIEQASANVAVS